MTFLKIDVFFARKLFVVSAAIFEKSKKSQALSEGGLPRALTGVPSTPAFRVLGWSCAGNPSRRISAFSSLGYTNSETALPSAAALGKWNRIIERQRRGTVLTQTRKSRVRVEKMVRVP